MCGACGYEAIRPYGKSRKAFMTSQQLKPYNRNPHNLITD